MPTGLIYKAAGSVCLPSCTDISVFSCWLCGKESERGVSTKKQIKPTFTDIDFAKSPESKYVCEACAWTMNERDEQLTALVGKETPQRMRNYSHIVKGGIWYPCSKANKSQMQDLIFEGSLPELIVLALSGQKHLIFKARCNSPGTHTGYILVEENLVYVDNILARDDLLLVELLYSTFSKSEIETGDYKQHRIRDFGLSIWQQCEGIIKSWRGTTRFNLALFLAQKREDARERFTTKCRYTSYVDLGRNTERIQDSISAQHMGTIRGGGKNIGLHEQSGQIYQPTLFEI